jgi:ribosome biogenesis GTPase
MPSGNKDKGTGRYGQQRGMGRLRSANTKDTGRLVGWEARVDDDAFLERHGANQRSVHAGERLLSRFNRLVAGRIGTRAGGEPAEVCEVRPGLVVVRAADGSEREAAIRRSLEKRISGLSNTLAVGDRVRVADEAGSPVICAIEPRRTQLARADSHNRALEHVLAANVDLLVAVASVHDPDFKHGFVDRALILAAAGGIAGAVAVTKRDLGDPDAIVALYRGLGLPCVTVDARDPADPGIGELRGILAGRSCVFAGQSGVGKSTLVNACFPGSAARVGSVAEAGFGRHTTTCARSFLLAGGGRLIDTPGIRECVVGGLGAVDVALLYPELARYQGKCRFDDCTHRHEPDCAVKAALEAGEIAISRYFSYVSIVEEDLAEKT